MPKEKEKEESITLHLKQEVKKVGSEVAALTIKNFLVFYRNLYSSLLLVIMPILICFYLQYAQDTIDTFGQRLQNPNPKEYQLAGIPKCQEHNCVTLTVGLTGGSSEWTEYILSHIAKTSELELDKDIYILPNGKPSDFLNYFKDNKSSSKIALLLCSNQATLPDNRFIEYINCTENQLYLLLYNFSFTSRNQFDTRLPNPVDHSVLSVKLAVDNAIFSYKSSKQGLGEVFIEILVSAFPLPVNRHIKGHDAISLQGPLFFFIPPMFVFGLLVSEIVKEKEQRLRSSLTVIGISATSFWLSWFLIGFLLAFLTSNSLILSAYIFKFDLFLKTPYLIMLIVLMTYTLTMIVLGFLLSTFITSVKLAYTISYSFLLGGLVLQHFFISPLLMKLFHVKDLPDWVPWVRSVFSYYPPFNFSKIFGDIAAKAGSLPSHDDKMWITGPGYSWDDFFMIREGTIREYTFLIPSSFISLQNLLWNFMIFVILTWYFDHIIEGNRGRPSIWWFFITRDYWRCRRRNDAVECESDAEGIKLQGIWKKYPGTNRLAVKPLEFIIHKEECIAIIGHNGAGKTSLINMLTGLLIPSGGTAFISSYDICHDFEKIHNLIGLCPQFNILWEELTAREHLELFCKLKNTAKELRYELIEFMLKQVNLLCAADRAVKTYSGGMKRRLSVAISSIGSPAVIFMDEPTTGMDPIARREVWKLIQELKKGRVIILTTHSMEEAEMLSDRVVVMVDGQIKCSGTCLFLKNHYGEGFKVEIIDKNPEELWKYLKESIASLRLLDISGNSLYVTLPRNCQEDSLKFFELIESLHTQEWGISNGSLEEVFMRVTGKIQDLGD